MNATGPYWWQVNVLLIGIFRSSHDNALQWMPQDLTDDKSILVQVMAWCRQATSHYLSQCWLSSLSPYDIARPQWVNVKTIFPDRNSHYEDKAVSFCNGKCYSDKKASSCWKAPGASRTLEMPWDFLSYKLPFWMSSGQQMPLLLTWINYNPNMSK